MSRIKEITKEFEGKKIYGEPTGNGARHYKNIEPIVFNVIKVKRKYFDCINDNSRWEQTLCTRSGTPQGGFNTGYIFYASEKDFHDSIQNRKNLRVISDFFGGWSSEKRDLTLDQTNKILKIINKSS